jgi:hypothetical protein
VAHKGSQGHFASSTAVSVNLRMLSVCPRAKLVPAHAAPFMTSAAKSSAAMQQVVETLWREFESRNTQVKRHGSQRTHYWTKQDRSITIWRFAGGARTALVKELIKDFKVFR